jgi:kumamolisin
MPNVRKKYRQLPGGECRPGPRAKLLGPAKDTETLTVTIVLRRRPDGPPVPDYSYYLTTPPAQRRRLSNAEFARKYGADEADIDKVTDFARTHGLAVVETHLARRTVVVSGTVAQFNEAFSVELKYYEHEVVRGRERSHRTETYRGHDGFIHIPEDLVEVVVGVFGLDNRRITKRNAGDPPGTTTITVQQVTKLYDFPSNLAAGQTIAIFSEAGYLHADISSNFAGSPPVVIDVPVDASNLGFADPETTQDIFIAGSAAPGAEIAVYFTTYSQQGWVDLIARVIHPNAGDPQCSVLSSSFYVSNGDDAATLLASHISSGWLTAVTQMFEDAAIQGVTVCIASGDTGADSKVGDGLAHVQYPASDPWVLSVGGTTIGNISGSNFDEYAWNDTFSFGGFSGNGATGGGISDLFPQPSYQVDAGVPLSVNDGHRGRGVPDVSANASPNSGYPIILNGALFFFPASGTSASAPLWAGLIAVVNAALNENVGFVNPVLYALGSSVFRDIIAEPGATDNSLNGVTGYPVGPGWDACTGWGSPKGIALLHGLQHFYGPAIAVNLQDNLSFGIVCRGPKFLTLQIFNVGTKNLFIISVQRLSGSSDFTVLPAPATPLAIAPGDQVNLTIEYDPTIRGLPEAATIRIVSDDPVTPLLDLVATGFGGTGALETVIADDGNFGDCCVGSFVSQGLTLNNNGPCTLSILNVTSSSPEFVMLSVSSYPLIVAAGESITLPIRFQPSSFGSKSATITVFSDDPAGPKSVHVSGNAPAGKLAVTGSTFFGGVKACCREERTISICNVGDCKLNIASVAFKHKNRHWKLINNPFPATLHPGSCLSVVIRYKATEKYPRSCDLVITSDDPITPVKTLEVVASTIWSDCCRKCCEDCRKGTCEKRHCDPCCCGKCHDERHDEEDEDVDAAVD